MTNERRRATAWVRRLGLLTVAWLAAMLAPVAFAQEAPDALVKRVSQEALAIIKTDAKVQAGEQARIRELIESKLTPHFDIDRMTALAAGRAYRTATPEQKQRLGEEFKTLLIRTYSTALNQYRDQTIDYKPLRADPGATDVTVRTEVIRPGQTPVEIDYSMEKVGEAWKVYDVKIEGISLVENYRNTFNSEVQKNGVDGLLKALVEKNRTLSAAQAARR